MEKDEEPLRRLLEEFAKFEKAMEEIHWLKLVANDLRCFRKMIPVKRYD